MTTQSAIPTTTSVNLPYYKLHSFLPFLTLEFVTSIENSRKNSNLIEKLDSTKKNINRVVTGTFPQLTIAIFIEYRLYLILCF